MPLYTAEAISLMDNPYIYLIEEESLIENRDILDTLSYSKKVELIQAMVLGCPMRELNNFLRTADALSKPDEEQDCFHATLMRAIQVRKRIHAMADIHHPHPHTLLLGEEFNPDLFNEFTNLTKQLISVNLHQISLNLVKKSPADDFAKLAQNIQIAFASTLLPEKSRNAMLVFKLLRDLKGDNPLTFIVSPEINPALFEEFSSLVHDELKSYELSIARNLASLPLEEHYSISFVLSLIAPLPTDIEIELNPFRLIQTYFCSFTEDQQEESSPLSGILLGTDLDFEADFASTSEPQQQSLANNPFRFHTSNIPSSSYSKPENDKDAFEDDFGYK